MLKLAIIRLLAAAYGPTHRLARFGMWVFGVYGVLILAVALAADRAAASFPVYGKPLASAGVINILDRLCGAAVAKIRAG